MTSPLSLVANLGRPRWSLCRKVTPPVLALTSSQPSASNASSSAWNASRCGPRISLRPVKKTIRSWWSAARVSSVVFLSVISVMRVSCAVISAASSVLRVVSSVMRVSWPVISAASSPFLFVRNSICQAHEPMRVQTLRPKTTVKTLDKRVISGLTRCDVMPFNALILAPF